MKFHQQNTLVQNNPLLRKAFLLLLFCEARGRVLRIPETVLWPPRFPRADPGRAAAPPEQEQALHEASPRLPSEGDKRSCRLDLKPGCTAEGHPWGLGKANKTCELTGRF